MASTTILLREDIDALGGRGEIVKVKAGYARNYLLPKGLATLATKGNVKQIEQEREALLKRAAEERSTAEAQKEQMGNIELTFERLAGEGGTLTVTEGSDPQGDISIHGLSALVFSGLNPAVLPHRGWGVVQPDVHATLQSICPSIMPHLHEQF